MSAEAEPPPPPPPLLSSPLLVFSFFFPLQLQAQALPLPQAMLFPQTDQEIAPRGLSGCNIPQSLRWFLNPEGSDGEQDAGGGGDGDDGGLESGDTAVKGTLLAGLLLVGVVGGYATVGYVYKDQINAFLTQFSGFIEDLGFLWALVVAI